MNNDYSLAVSGIACPGGDDTKSGRHTIWTAINKREGFTRVESLQLSGDRHEIIEQCVQELLCYLLKTVEMVLGR